MPRCSRDASWSRCDCPRLAQLSWRCVVGAVDRRAGLVGRRDGRSEVVNGYRLTAAVGAVALTAALSGASAYGGSSGPAQAGGAIKIGALTPLTGPFAPWGIQVRAGMALAVNEINRAGGVKGRGAGRQLNLVVADDQSTNTTAAVDGFRRLTQQENVVSVGGSIRRPIGRATTRLAVEGKI